MLQNTLANNSGHHHPNPPNPNQVQVSDPPSVQDPPNQETTQADQEPPAICNSPAIQELSAVQNPPLAYEQPIPLQGDQVPPVIHNSPPTQELSIAQNPSSANEQPTPPPADKNLPAVHNPPSAQQQPTVSPSTQNNKILPSSNSNTDDQTSQAHSTSPAHILILEAQPALDSHIQEFNTSPASEQPLNITAGPSNPFALSPLPQTANSSPFPASPHSSPNLPSPNSTLSKSTPNLSQLILQRPSLPHLQK